MRFDDRFLDEIRARVPLADVVARKVKLTRAGRELKGLCPFHKEKTPSFSVVEDKGFYHCFGCGAHGSHFDFVMAQEGLSFPEAVESLAAQAGLQMPKADPQAAAREQQRAGLHDVMAMAARWYQAQLATSLGQEARAYLERRGVSAQSIETFALGYAPKSRTALKDALAARDIPAEVAVEAGLLIQPDDGGEAFDRFRNRLMFPIEDSRGRVIAFGGRALDANAKAKYLNSPETPLFHKGHTLYNLHRARKAAFDAQRVLVAEGYMDVIALAQAGLGHAVAPLGTAMTEDQLKLLWRMAPAPALCFDGDNAGQRAARKAVSLSLPLLQKGLSVELLFLPEGEDPDSLLKSGGQDAVTFFDQPKLLHEAIWDFARQDVGQAKQDDPISLDAALDDYVSKIADKEIRFLYKQEFRSKISALYARRRQDFWASKSRSRTSSPSGQPLSDAVKGSEIARGLDMRQTQRLIALYFCNHPELIAHHEEDIVDMSFDDGQIQHFRGVMLDALTDNHVGSVLEFEDYAGRRDRQWPQLIDALRHHPALVPLTTPKTQTPLAAAEAGLCECLRLYRRRSLEAELQRLQAIPLTELGEVGFARIRSIRQELHHHTLVRDEDRDLLGDGDI